MGDPVVLRELEGDLREVVLGDSKTPERGVEVGGQVRMASTMYPGATGASVQVMGTEEEPITVQGWLIDTWIGKAGGAGEAKAAIESLRLGQRYCQIQWGTDIDARGFVKRTKFRYNDPGRIRYEIEFMVVESGRVEQVQVRTPTEGETDWTNAVDAVVTDLDEVVGIYEASGSVPSVI